jgi:tryptophan synthase alpha chain
LHNRLLIDTFYQILYRPHSHTETATAGFLHFLYSFQTADSTGAQKDFDARKQVYFKKIQDMNLRNPRMVGFGISNRQTFDTACSHASGAIIGSRFVTLLDEYKGNAQKAISHLKEDLGKSGKAVGQ